MSAKIHEIKDPQGWRFHSGNAIYTERFLKGRLIAASLQSTGIPYYPDDEDIEQSAFDLQIDGESLYFDWELIESIVEETAGNVPSAKIILKNTHKPLQLEVVTEACGDGFFRRRMRLTNISSSATLGLSSVTPFCGTLWAMRDNIGETLLDNGGVPYQAGWFQDTDACNEGNFQWQEIPLNTELAFGSTRGKSGHSSPFVVAQNNIDGGYFVAHLAWSANWRMSFFTRYRRDGSCRLEFALMPLARAPMRLISPGETINLPEVHFGLNHTGFDDAIQCWHNYLRNHVLRVVGNGKQPVIHNHWGFMQHELSEAGLFHEIDIATEIGAELFMVDAGWYADLKAPWPETTGDWKAGNRLPNDLFPVFEYARSKGLLCGLWVEIESAGKASNLAKEHPEWFIKRYGNPVERILDLTRPEVAEYVESQIMRIIDCYKLDMFRLDYNIRAQEGGFNEHDGFRENTLWRHVEVIYAIFDKVRQRYPNLQLENCAGGGGRTDLGMVSRFTTSWVSDWMIMPRTVRILNGMTMALPPEYVNRLFGAAMKGSCRGNPETQLQVAILGHMAISGITPNLDEANPEIMRLVKKYINLYKNFIRPFHREAKVYHHTPVIPGAEGSGWCALEYVSADRKKAVAAVFRLVNAKEERYCLRFRGLNPKLNYSVTVLPGDRQFEISGHGLEQGHEVRLDNALTSVMLLCEAMK